MVFLHWRLGLLLSLSFVCGSWLCFESVVHSDFGCATTTTTDKAEETARAREEEAARQRRRLSMDPQLVGDISEVNMDDEGMREDSARRENPGSVALAFSLRLACPPPAALVTLQCLVNLRTGANCRTRPLGICMKWLPIHARASFPTTETRYSHLS